MALRSGIVCVMGYTVEPGHRRSIRLPTWDYRDSGAYFVTICSLGRRPMFGKFVGDELVLGRFGEIVADVWHEIPDHFPAMGTDAFVVMPNHVHGIIWIQRDPGVEARTTVGARHASPLRPIGAPSGALGAIVGSFKSAATRRINHLRGTPGAAVWQRNYYERIIRDDRELERAREYVLDNPRKWGGDKHNPAVFRELASHRNTVVGGRHASPLRPISASVRL